MGQLVYYKLGYEDMTLLRRRPETSDERKQERALPDARPEYFIAFLAVILSLAAFKTDIESVKVVWLFNTSLYVLGIIFVVLLLIAAYLYAFEDSLQRIKVILPRLSAVLITAASWFYFLAVAFPLTIGIAIGMNYLLAPFLNYINLNTATTGNTNTVIGIILGIIPFIFAILGSIRFVRVGVDGAPRAYHPYSLLRKSTTAILSVVGLIMALLTLYFEGSLSIQTLVWIAVPMMTAVVTSVAWISAENEI